MKKIATLCIALCAMTIGYANTVSNSPDPCRLALIENNDAYHKFYFEDENGFTELVLFKDNTYSFRRHMDGGNFYLSFGDWTQSASGRVEFSNVSSRFDEFVQKSPPGSKEYISYSLQDESWSVSMDHVNTCY